MSSLLPCCWLRLEKNQAMAYFNFQRAESTKLVDWNDGTPIEHFIHCSVPLQRVQFQSLQMTTIRQPSKTQYQPGCSMSNSFQLWHITYHDRCPCLDALFKLETS